MSTPSCICQETTVRAAYSVAELAKMAGLEARRLVRILTNAQVPIRGAGGRGASQEVLLQDVQQGFPELWNSIQMRRGLARDEDG